MFFNEPETNGVYANSGHIIQMATLYYYCKLNIFREYLIVIIVHCNKLQGMFNTEITYVGCKRLFKSMNGGNTLSLSLTSGSPNTSMSLASGK